MADELTIVKDRLSRGQGVTLVDIRLLVDYSPTSNVKRTDERSEGQRPEMFISKLQHAVESRGFVQTFVQLSDHRRWRCLKENLATVDSHGNHRAECHESHHQRR